ncbi:hypothetical protein FB565_006088 [Actinoplanes lutulentus]|uniref:Uncharacterized protein n=1 Tax=Actinoplanes lutulentus TaxID=1287878 RepID=A0A327Z3H2_9ACTN|nr:hypothetical protein [Actinoplanes lutulentus]RAK28741.1 hypothetical protein B0I29_11978 [Actinoplanes lutulentus]
MTARVKAIVLVTVAVAVLAALAYVNLQHAIQRAM